MVLFHSMKSISFYTLLTTILLITAATKQNPVRILFSFIQDLFTSFRFFIHFAGLILILLLNKMELRFEHHPLSYSDDWTAAFYSIEGHIVKSIQLMFQNDWLTLFLSFMYLVVFQSLMLASLVIYSMRSTMFYASCYAIMLNYLIAIPFFIFIPINEVWAFPQSGVEFLMLDSYPSFESQYRLLSGINNCFPSLHTSMSVTLAFLAIRSGNKRWAFFVSSSAIVIIFSIFYLGIHWVTDMIGGIILGLLASMAGIKLSQLYLFSSRLSVVLDNKAAE